MRSVAAGYWVNLLVPKESMLVSVGLPLFASGAECSGIGCMPDSVNWPSSVTVSVELGYLY